MELTAITIAVVITPLSAPPDIHTDSQSAMHMMHHAMAPVASRELHKSPDAFLWLHLQSWLQLRQAPRHGDLGPRTLWKCGEREGRPPRSLSPRRPLGYPVDDPNATAP